MSRPTLNTEELELPLPTDPERRILGRLVSAAAEERGAPTPVVILAHGYKSPLSWGWFPELQERLARAGLASIAFLHSHSGLTRSGDHVTEEDVFARNTYTRELEDLALLRAWIDTRRVELDAARVGLYGYSRGGGMGVLHAAERGDYGALALWAPMDRVLKFGSEALELWRTRGWTLATEYSTGRQLRLGPELLADAELNRERLDIPAAAARLRAPVLLVGAERDVAAPPDQLRQLAQSFSAACLEQHCLPGVGHGFGLGRAAGAVGPQLERALDLTVSHFAACLVAPAP